MANARNLNQITDDIKREMAELGLQRISPREYLQTQRKNMTDKGYFKKERLLTIEYNMSPQ